MDNTYKFTGHNATDLLERGSERYGAARTNQCECPVCFGGKKIGMLACKNCKGSGMVENKKFLVTLSGGDETFVMGVADEDVARKEIEKRGSGKIKSIKEVKENNQTGKEVLKETDEKEPTKSKKKTGPFYENKDVEGCADCDGTGKVKGQNCKECRGTGHSMSS